MITSQSHLNLAFDFQWTWLVSGLKVCIETHIRQPTCLQRRSALMNLSVSPRVRSGLEAVIWHQAMFPALLQTCCRSAARQV